MNEGQPGRIGLINMIGDATGLTIPAVFTTFDAGANLAQTPGAQVRVTRIGAIEAEPGLRLVDAGGQRLARDFGGFDHFGA